MFRCANIALYHATTADFIHRKWYQCNKRTIKVDRYTIWVFKRFFFVFCLPFHGQVRLELQYDLSTCRLNRTELVTRVILDHSELVSRLTDNFPPGPTVGSTCSIRKLEFIHVYVVLLQFHSFTCFSSMPTDPLPYWSLARKLNLNIFTSWIGSVRWWNAKLTIIHLNHDRGTVVLITKCMQ